MHELLLYGQVPLERHEQVLKILTGIAAMQPKTLYERHLIYKPLRANEETKPNKKYPNKPIRPQTVSYQQLIKELHHSEFGKESPILAESNVKDDVGHTAYAWKLKSQETPEPETKTLVLRQASESAVDNEQLRKFLEPTNHGFVNEFIIEGHRLIHKNVILTMFRLLRIDDAPQPAPSTHLPTLQALKPLDPSGGFLLEACARVDDRTKPNLVSAATDDLTSFSDLLRGSVDMKAPDRLSLDTRVR